MLSKNVVLIETIDSMGTGFIYPCIYENKRNVFIILTNAHVLSSFENKENEDYKDDIIIYLYDDSEKLIERSNFEEIKIFYKNNNTEYEDDIAAILIILKEEISLTLELNIFDSFLDNRKKIYIEGYPGVMLNDSVYQKIQLEGYEKSTFPQNEKIGIYQITDDYHWYNNFKDRDLVEGLSGSPIYYQKNENLFVLGIACSVCNISEGENPFKIIYYIRIRHILDYLRKNNCIIFSKSSEFQYKIVWTYYNKSKKRNESNNEDREISLLMIGGSGSGKSTFAKNFSYHGEKINSTNDGQTTRTKVIYEYKLFPEDANIEATIKLLKQDDFVDNMIFRLDYSFYREFIKHSLSLSKDSVKDENYFLINVQSLIQKIINKEIINKKRLIELDDKIKRIIKGEINNKLKNDVYGELVEYLNEVEVKSYIKDELDKGDSAQYTQNEKDVIDLMRELYQEINSFFSKFEFLKYLLKIEGYFDIEEFNELFKDEQNNSNEHNVIKEVYGILEKNNKKDDSNNNKKLMLDDYLTEIYKEVYSILKDKIKKKYGFNENNIKFSLLDMDKKYQNLLEQSLQVTPLGSLTGIIDYVKIEDRISNEYAMIMWDLGIDKLKLIDTCGLDHIEVFNKNIIKENILRNLYDSEKSTNIKYSDVSILYFKKLDAGKPDELRGILPSIRETIPAAPLYCVFTGIDIFYKNPDEIKSILWKKESNKIPKAVNYIFSRKGKEDLLGSEKDNNFSSNSMYLTLKNNLVAYCGLKDKELNNFQIYSINIRHIRKLLVSICMKEYSSLEIAKNIENEDDFYKDNKNIIDNIIKNIFDKASIHNDYFRWNTKEADISGNKRKEKTFGYYGRYRHYVHQLFHEAYVKIINSTEIITPLLDIALFKSNKNAIYSSLKNMENEFLGNYESLTKLEDSDKDKKNFRSILKYMYQEKYQYNPYANECNKKFIDIKKYKDKRDEIFKDIFNFNKGLECQVILEQVGKWFCECLKEQIKRDNIEKSNNMLKLNEEFTEKLNELKVEFIEKYSIYDDTQNAKEKFNDLMSYYFSNKKVCD